VIVNNLDVECISALPGKTEPPLVVDANAVLAGAIPFQMLQTIARGRSEIAKFDGAVQLPQLPPSDLFDGRKSRDSLTAVKLLRVSTTKRPDHTISV